jgi:hypothetical protein
MTIQNYSPATMQAQNSFLAPSANEIGQITEFCKVLANTPFYQKLGVGGVMAIYLSSRELQLPFMACLNGGLYTFDGKVTMSAQLMNMMLVQKGHYVKIVENTEKCCKLHFVRTDRKNDNTFDYEFNIEMAVKAGYMNKAVWRQHTRDMLFARALSGGARKFMPDVLMNCYVHGEILEAEVDVTPSPDPSKVEQIPCITTDQANEIRDLLAKCDEDFCKTVDNHLSKKKISCLEEMQVTFFEPLKKFILKHIEKSYQPEEKANEG